MRQPTDDELRAMATRACIESFGADEWSVMFSGDQDAHVDTWIEGFKAGLQYAQDHHQEASSG